MTQKSQVVPHLGPLLHPTHIKHLVTFQILWELKTGQMGAATISVSTNWTPHNVRCNTISSGNMNIPNHLCFLIKHSLEMVTTIQGLGNILSSDLKNAAHCISISLAAFNNAKLILSAFHSTDPVIFTGTFKTYIRHLLSVALIMWKLYGSLGEHF